MSQIPQILVVLLFVEDAHVLEVLNGPKRLHQEESKDDALHAATTAAQDSCLSHAVVAVLQTLMRLLP